MNFSHFNSGTHDNPSEAVSAHENPLTTSKTVEIEEHDRIDTAAALALAQEHFVEVPPSTLRRWQWAWRHWEPKEGNDNARPPVRCLLTYGGKEGKKTWISKEDWIAYLYEIKDERPLSAQENPQDPTVSRENSSEPVRTHENSRETANHQTQEQDPTEPETISASQLNQLTELKFELEVERRISEAKTKNLARIQREREQDSELIGALKYKLRELDIPISEIARIEQPYRSESQDTETKSPGGLRAGFAPATQDPGVMSATPLPRPEQPATHDQPIRHLNVNENIRDDTGPGDWSGR